MVSRTGRAGLRDTAAPSVKFDVNEAASPSAEPVPAHAAMLDAALDEAHLPALLAAAVHLTGDHALLTPERQARYERFASIEILRLGGYSPEIQADIRTRAKAAIQRHLAGAPLPSPPEIDTISDMMNIVAGAQIPARYREFLLDQLGIGDAHTPSPRQNRPAGSAMHVVVIGAGMSGLLAAIRLKQAGIGFTVIEKNSDVGGTWFENVYPGCRVDNPNHLYSYSFEPSHAFPQYFSPQPVLLDYFRGVAEKHDLRPHIRFETEVDGAVFDETSATWRVTLRTADGASETIAANALISAVGQLNRPNVPDIPGLESFTGPRFHSATWRQDVDLTGKRVAVIGTGASAYQFVPEIAPAVAHLDIFQRTPPWSMARAHYHREVPDAKKWLMEHVPFYAAWYRFYLFWSLVDGVYPALKSDPDWAGSGDAVSAENAALGAMVKAAMGANASDRPDLLAKIIPDYPFGGKRALLDNGDWLKTLRRDNVDLVTAGIERITEGGIVTRDGVEHPADVIIFGTGFQASRFLSPMKIVGRGGVELQTAWNGDARAHLGISTPGFPNLFMLYGPNTNLVVNGSVIFMSECAVRYIMGCLALLTEQGARSLDVRGDVHDAFNRRIDAGNAQMAWGAPHVSSWFKNATGRVSQNWPFPLVDYWNATIAPDPADFHIDRGAQSLRATGPASSGASL